MTDRRLGCLLLLAVFAASMIALLRWLERMGAQMEDVDPYSS